MKSSLGGVLKSTPARCLRLAFRAWSPPRRRSAPRASSFVGIRRLVLRHAVTLAGEIELGGEMRSRPAVASSGFTLCSARRCTNRRFTE